MSNEKVGPTESEIDQVGFEAAARPLVKWLAQNVHPHHTAIVTGVDAQLLEGSCTFKTHDYLVD